MPTNRRHVFLDNERSAAAIRAQLDEAVYRSRMEGEIIAIGHLDKVTIEVLSKELPGLAKRGADLVKPSDLVRARASPELANDRIRNSRRTSQASDHLSIRRDSFQVAGID